MSSENWQISHDAAALYEKYVSPLMLPWVETLIEKAEINKGERVLEVACGTGFAARLAAKRVGFSGEVIGTDINKGMIATATEIARREVSLKIEWQEADVINLPFDDERFEVVLCQQGMQFFPDIPSAVKELERVLVPGGRLVFTIWAPIEENPYLDALAKALENHLSAEAAVGLRGAFKKSFSNDFESSFMRTGFTQIERTSPILNFHLPPLDEYVPGHMASLPMADAIMALPVSKKMAILDEVKKSLEVFVNEKGLHIPSRSEVIKAVK